MFSDDSIHLEENAGKNWLGVPPLFTPEKGQSIIEPPGSGQGYWAGAPSIIYDSDSSYFYLCYRMRRPRGEGRGYENRIAKSKDGIHFDTVFTVKKEEIKTQSLERSSLIKGLDGIYRFYFSYVDPETNMWRVDYIEAPEVEEFNINNRKKLMTAPENGLAAVKDPYVLVIGSTYYMFLSYAPQDSDLDESTKSRMHNTGDVFTTGITKSCSGLATSLDGKNFTWQGDVLSPPEQGWDSYATRITSIMYVPPVFTAFYDGIPSVDSNYEEKAGLASSFNLTDFERITKKGPRLTSPNESGSLRYIDFVPYGDKVYFYYEYTKEDGSHEVRLNIKE